LQKALHSVLLCSIVSHNYLDCKTDFVPDASYSGETSCSKAIFHMQVIHKHAVCAISVTYLSSAKQQAHMDPSPGSLPSAFSAAPAFGCFMAGF